MIAKILKSAVSFNGVLYNEEMVTKGIAKLLEIKGFGKYEILGYDNPKQLVGFLEEYTSRNDRIRKPQFHLVLYCKGNEMSHSELLEFAHKYLDEMGYGDPEQPLLIYGHFDNPNNHIHIISSRVSPDGKKIDHHHERRKSQKIINRLLGIDIGLKTREDIKSIFKSGFNNKSEFMNKMISKKYECYEKDDYIYIKKGGMVIESILSEDIEKYQKKITIYRYYDCHYS